MASTDSLAYKMSVWVARAVGAPTDLSDVYDVDTNCVLGVGAFGRVMKGTDKVTGRFYAIKQIGKSSDRHSGIMDRRMRAEALKQEVEVMQRMDHRNIVRLFEHYEDSEHHYLVMQLCSGGKLVDFLARKQDYRESDAALLMGQVLSALKYMHNKHIVHRDVKPDNMLMDSWSPLPDNTLKLIDFGLSCRCAAGSDVRLSAGTPEFISPQAIDSCYDTQTDLWSCGASLYFLLCGFVPFRADSEAGVFAAVRRGNFSMQSSEWQNVSNNAKDLIRSMLKMNPRDRITAEEALNHVWVRQGAPGSNGLLQKALSSFSVQNVRRKRPQKDTNAMMDISSVLNDVTQWANSLLPNNKLWESNSLDIRKPEKSLRWI